MFLKVWFLTNNKDCVCPFLSQQQFTEAFGHLFLVSKFYRMRNKRRENTHRSDAELSFFWERVGEFERGKGKYRWGEERFGFHLSLLANGFQLDKKKQLSKVSFSQQSQRGNADKQDGLLLCEVLHFQVIF